MLIFVLLDNSFPDIVTEVHIGYGRNFRFGRGHVFEKKGLQPGNVFNLWCCQYPANTGTCKEPLGGLAKTNGKIDIFTVKMYFESNGLCIAYLFLVFTGGSNIPNSLMGMLMGRSGSKSWDTLGTPVGYQQNKFLNSTLKQVELTLTG